MERNIALYHGLIREQELRCPVRKLPHDGRSVCPSTTPAIGWIGSGRVKKRQRVRASEREVEMEMERKGAKPGSLIMMCPQA